MGPTIPVLVLPGEERLHVVGVEYDKQKLKDIYGRNGVIGNTTGLLPLYDILIRMFRESIAPSAGNNDAIRGALVHLLHRAFLAVSDGHLMAGVWRFDVIDYIFHDLYDAVMGNKAPPYAPYVAPRPQNYTDRKSVV